jgi:hypothetical protein
MIMYFTVVPSPAPLGGRWPPVGAGNRILDILHQDFFAGLRQCHLGAGEDVAVDLDVDAVLARVEPADGDLPERVPAADGPRSAGLEGDGGQLEQLRRAAPLGDCHGQGRGGLC